MIVTKLLLFLFICYLVSQLQVLAIDLGPKTSDSFGPYDLNITTYSACQGPKAKSGSNLTVDMETRDGDIYEKLNITFFEQVRLEESRITIYSVKNNKKSVLWNYRVKKPCQHFVIANIMEQFFHTTNCVIPKGNAVMEFSLTEYTRQFFGTSFFYGEYQVKSYGLSKNANVGCIIMGLIIKKKNN